MLRPQSVASPAMAPYDLFDVVDGAVVVRVHAQPGASRSGVSGRHGDALKVKVAAPPADGRANAALAEVLATLFGVRPGDVALVSGHASRSKRFRVAGVGAEQARATLSAAVVDPRSRQ